MNIPIKLQISEAHKTIYLHLYFPRFKCPPTYIYMDSSVLILMVLRLEHVGGSPQN